MPKDTGGPAFPSKVPVMMKSQIKCALDKVGDQFHEGMTLRDYLAGQTLVGYLSMKTRCYELLKPKDIASKCYLVADAMIAESKK